MSKRLFALILAGGQSSRLYPFNKVLSDLTGSGRTLIQQAFDRTGLPRDHVRVLTAQEMVKPISKQLKIPHKNIFVDPERRGTWPAILWAMAHLRDADPEAVLAIITGDHVIQGVSAFKRSFHEAISLARRDAAIAMLGIRPSRDAEEWRGFGCFRADRQGRIVQFLEKPTTEEASGMIREGAWQWNSGMFFMRISTAEAALQEYQPEMHQVYLKIVRALRAKKENVAKACFKEFPSKIPHVLDANRVADNSIDYAILTPLMHRPVAGLTMVAANPVRFTWTDLGQWTALRHVTTADGHGNVRIGRARLGNDVRNSILVAERGSEIHVSGLSDVVVAFAGGKALVVPISELPRIKELVQKARRQSKPIVTAGLPGISVKRSGKRLVVSSKQGFIR